MDEDAEFKESSRFRALSEEVDAVLVSFERAAEWADLIKCLQRLNKALQKCSPLPVIPAQNIVTRRLAQCLNPDLPSGVHAKTLETYELIFSKIGGEKLSRTLALYSSGLFPLLHHASMAVKVSLLTIYEKYYLPLGDRLCVCLPGLVAGLLPGLDSENTELHTQVNGILDILCESTEALAFWTAVWQTLLLVPHARTTSLSYLSSRFQRMVQTLPPHQLVLGALAAGLSDSSVLVQRATLDLLIAHLPADCGVFDSGEQATLVRSMLHTALRRDQSLNRRLYSWLIGGSDFRKDYFVTFVRKPLIWALKNVFRESPRDSATAARPYRMASAVFAKTDICVLVVSDVLLDILSHAHRFGDGMPFSHEVGANVESVLQQLDAEAVWNCLTLHVTSHSVGSSASEAIGVAGFMDGLLDKLLVHSNPPMALRLSLLKSVMSGMVFRVSRIRAIVEARMSPPNVVDYGGSGSVSSTTVVTECDALRSLAFFAMRLLRTIDQDSQAIETMHATSGTPSSTGYLTGKCVCPLPPTDPAFICTCGATDRSEVANLCVGLYGDLVQIISQHLAFASSARDSTVSDPPRCTSAVNVVAQLLVSFYLPNVNLVNLVSPAGRSVSAEPPTKVPDSPLLVRQSSASKTPVQPVRIRSNSFGARSIPKPLAHAPGARALSLEELPLWLQRVLSCCQDPLSTVSLVGVSALLDIMSNAPFLPKGVMAALESSAVIDKFVIAPLWMHLPTSHQAASLLGQFCTISPSCANAVAAAVSSRLVKGTPQERADAARKFGLLWAAAGPRKEDPLLWAPSMFLMIDMLTDASPGPRFASRSWLQQAYSHMDRLFDPLILELLRAAPIASSLSSGGMDVRRTCHIARVIEEVVRAGAAAYSRSAPSTPLSDILSPTASALAAEKSNDVIQENSTSYLSLLVALALKYMHDEKDMVQIASASLLHTLLSHIGTSVKAAHAVHAAGAALLPLLASASERRAYSVQRALLDCMHVVVVLQAATAGAAPLRETSPSDEPNRFAMPQHEHHLCQKPQFINTIIRALRIHTDPAPMTSPSDIVFYSIGNVPGTVSMSRRAMSTGSVASHGRTESEDLGTGMEDASGMYTHWVDFVCTILPQIITYAAASAGQLVRCYADVIAALAQAEEDESVIQTLSQPLTPRERSGSFSSIGRSSFEVASSAPYMEANKPSKPRGPPGVGSRPLVHGLAYILQVCLLNDQHTSNLVEDHAKSVGFFGAVMSSVTSMFSSPDVASAAPEAPANMAKVTALKELPAAVDALIKISASAPVDVAHQIQNLLDSLLRRYPSHTIAALMEVWRLETASAPSMVERGMSPAAEILLCLSSLKPDLLWEGCTDIILSIMNATRVHGFPRQDMRTSPSSLGKYLSTADLPITNLGVDLVLVYLYVLTPSLLKRYPLMPNTPALTKTWSHISSAFNELLLNCSVVPAFPVMLRLLDAFVKGNPDEILLDKKVRKELQDLTQKTAEVCAGFAAKASEVPPPLLPLQAPQTAIQMPVASVPPPSTIRLSVSGPTMPESGGPMLTPRSQVSQVSSEYAGNPARVPVSVVALSPAENPVALWESYRIRAKSAVLCCTALATVLPSLLQAVFDDRDRSIPVVQAVAARIVPMLRPKLGSDPAVAASAIAVVASYKHSPHIVRVWRKDILEALYDPDFFAMHISAVRAWSDAIYMVVASDPAIMNDLLSNLTLAGDWNQKARLLKRAAFVIHSGPKDAFLDILPDLQERIFDILKLPNATGAHIMAFMCLRVLIIQFSAQYIHPLWSAVIAELIRVFSSSNDPPLILEVLKLLDISLLLYPGEMQSYLWMFMSDWLSSAKDAVPVFAPYADRMLGIGRADLPIDLGAGRPLINVRSVTLVAQLQPLVDRLRAHATAAAAGTLAMPHFIDWTYIHSILDTDFIDPNPGLISVQDGWVVLEQTRENVRPPSPMTDAYVPLSAGTVQPSPQLQDERKSSLGDRDGRQDSAFLAPLPPSTSREIERQRSLARNSSSAHSRSNSPTHVRENSPERFGSD